MAVRLDRGVGVEDFEKNLTEMRIDANFIHRESSITDRTFRVYRELIHARVGKEIKRLWVQTPLPPGRDLDGLSREWIEERDDQVLRRDIGILRLPQLLDSLSSCLFGFTPRSCKFACNFQRGEYRDILQKEQEGEMTRVLDFEVVFFGSKETRINDKGSR